MLIVNTEFFRLTILLSSIKLSFTAGPAPVTSPHRERSRSPSARHRDSSTRLSPSDVLGYTFDQLESIRLTPTKNPLRQFQLRKYTFPADERIKVLDAHSVYLPVPAKEHIVLSTDDGDVFAILASNKTLSGIYKHNTRVRYTERAKINMKSGRTTILRPDEVEEVPVGRFHQIQYHFRITHVNHSYGSLAEPGIHASDTSPALPVSNVLGYRLDQLEFIRLCYKENPHRLFELRKYTFPLDKPIKILLKRDVYRPIPIQEQIVLTTYGGDIFAALESGNVFLGLYAYDPRTQRERRAKINMVSRRITSLTSDEIEEVPVGRSRQVRPSYIVDLVNEDPSHHHYL